jgi:ribonuclease HI
VSTHANYLRDLGGELRRLAESAAADARANRSDGFLQGQAHGLYTAVSLMHQRAVAFDLPARDLEFEGLDPDRDLVNRHRLEGDAIVRGAAAPLSLGTKAKTHPSGRNQAVQQDPAEVMKRATIHFDGGGESPGPVTAACIVELSDGAFVQDVKRFDEGTHNTAEWQALILGLRMALKHGERHVVVKGDSLLVVKQINREWKTKNAALQSLRAQAEELLALFETWRVEWIPRKENRVADELGRT